MGGVKHVVVDKHDNRHAKDKVEIRTRQAGAQQNHEEEEQVITTTTLEPGVTVKEAELNNLFLRFSHNKKIVIRRSLGDIELTKEDGDIFGIDILLDALRKWTNKAGREASKEQQKKRTWTMGATSSSSSPLSELAVYCKERRDLLNEAQVIHGGVNAKLRQRKQTGLLRMLSRLNCLNYTQITSTDIDRMIQILNENNIEAFIEFHKNILSKISYRPRRDPKLMWLCGAQIVGLDLQDEHSSAHIRTHNAMFSSNGSCGYVLKPEVLLTGPETSCIITLKIVEARHLRTLRRINEQLVNPHLRVTIEECEQMKDQVWDTEKQPMDRNIMNGFHTVWDAEFKEDECIGRVALNRNVAFLKFALSEVDSQDMRSQLGQCTLHLANIRPGLRRITFRNERDNKENIMAIALVDIQIYTMADIEESIERSIDDIDKGINELKVPGWTALERAELTKLKGDGIVQVHRLYKLKTQLKSEISDFVSRRETEKEQRRAFEAAFDNCGFGQLDNGLNN